jgi:hypothetical protein
MADGWTQTEVEAIVRDYFDMLSKELHGIPFKKSEHRIALLDTIPRSAGSIEYKHQNISAVLLELGMPFIAGYKPAKNYQRKVLPDAVLDYVIAHPEIQQQMSADVDADVAIPTVDDILGTLVQPPEPRTSPEPTMRARDNRKSVPVDYLAREASNRSLGAAGEQFVMNYEKARLLFAGKDSLSDRIEQVSVTESDAAGYDIRSYWTSPEAVDTSQPQSSRIIGTT